MQVRLALAALLAWVAGIASALADPPSSLTRDVYVWQRSWTPDVVDAVGAEAGKFQRLVILGAEISFHDGETKVAEIKPDYAAVRKAVAQIGLAIRIGPIPGALAAQAMAPGSEQAALICQTTAQAVDQARKAGLEVDEVQIDYDCAESKLAGYSSWVKALKEAASPVPVVITVLPSWLRHPEFAELARAAGSFVLQVHSLHKPDGPDAPMSLCDADEARSAVTEAAEIGVPFRVALPTYAYLAGFSVDGKLLGLSAEGVEPQWPAGTILRVMRSDPVELAALVKEWTAAHPPAMTGLIWYRLPVAEDTMNWRAVTLHSVMEGREPKANVRAIVNHTKPGLLDVYLSNDGDADGALQCAATVSWHGASLVTAEGIGGFEELDGPAGQVTFRAVEIPVGRWIAPGEKIQIGWLRLDADTEVQSNVTPLPPG